MGVPHDIIKNKLLLVITMRSQLITVCVVNKNRNDWRRPAQVNYKHIRK